MSREERFPFPEEVKIPPELEGWEEMYPPHYLFSKEREEWEKRHFWYHDKIHGPDPMYPLDLIFHEAWQAALAQYTTRTFAIPPAQGVAQRILGCYFYIAAVEPPPEEVVKEKAELFKKRVLDFVFKEYGPKMWESWLKRFRELGEKMARIEVPQELPKYESDDVVFPEPRGYSTAHKLVEAWNELINYLYRGWQYHFQYLNLTYLAYLMFTDLCKKLFPGISDSAIGKMVAGAYVQMFRPEEELCRLARLAITLPGVPEVLKKDVPAKQKMEELSKFTEGKIWLEEYKKIEDPWLYVSCGSGWYHYEGSWITHPDVPFGYLKSYIERLEKGERIERRLEEIDKRREEIVAEYRKLIKTEEDRKAFDEAYRLCRRIYTYAEDHLFWVEHWFHTIWFRKVREFGNVFVKYGFVKEVDDIFLFNRFEIPVMIEDLNIAWSLGEGVPPRAKYWREKAEKRKKILEAAKKWTPPPALGIPPKEVVEPFTVMLWGITTEKVKEWLKGVVVKLEEITEIKGFPSSSGLVEGPARVIKLVDQIGEVQPGEILVCPNTNPAWAPVFTKIKAAVTDIGGITSHAAIVSREYGLPAVTGTGIATSVIKTGDMIRVDGDRGVVTILSRAAQT
ncbi:MAG: PEP-utilizing enzyme [Candidatus Nezhaarchaeales archaeon]